MANVDTGNTSIWLSPSTTHSSLQSIGTGTGQHLVDTDNVEGVDTDTEMERFLSGDLDQVPERRLLVHTPRYLPIVPKSKVPTPSSQDSVPSLDPAEFVTGTLTCWRKYGRPPKPRNSIVHTRWKPSGCREGTRRRSHAFGRDRRCESLGLGHHG